MKYIVNVRFENRETYASTPYNRQTERVGKAYAYFTDIEGIEADDMVVVETPEGLKIVRVVKVVTDAASVLASAASKWIVSKVDIATYRKREEDAKRRDMIEQRLKQLAEEQIKKDAWAALVAANPEAAALVEELGKLQ